MLQERRLNSNGEQYVVGPTGTPLTLRDLPPSDTNRWVIRRKAEVVAAAGEFARHAGPEARTCADDDDVALAHRFPFLEVWTGGVDQR